MDVVTVNNVDVIYAGAVQVLHGISMKVADGLVTLLLGPNGCGKSTTLKAISGLLYAEEGKVTAGFIEYLGKRINNKSPEDIARMGIIQVLQGRKIFEHLTVEENLMVGGLTIKLANAKSRLAWVYDLFPRLKERRNQVSGYLSGGEQQMLVTGRGLMSQPKVMILDEPSMGLSPKIIEEVHSTIRKINEDEKITFLLVEQNAWAALGVSDYAYVMDNGRMVLDGPADKVRENRDVVEFHLGISELGQRKSYWDVKHYRRRKRWLG
ncbi:ABC transporter ATP-binding protein [Chloroflexota bacterium]